MITKQELLEAIAECQGTRQPNANTAIKLAAFYTILDHMDERQEPASYSYAAAAPDTIAYDGDSEFADAVNGKKEQGVLSVFEELMDVTKTLNERLYYGVIRKLNSI